MDITGIILAGGMGTRLAPISTPEKPKQFHDLLGVGNTLLELTIARAAKICSNIITLGNIRHEQILRAQLGKFSRNLILETSAKNTAASVFLAASAVRRGLMLIMPADHFISGDFGNNVMKASDLAEKGNIVTFGILPTHADTNYGYILNNKFAEKPDVFTARKLLEQGARWNSGIFLARAEVIFAEFKKHAPEFLECEFENMPKLPFDKAIMEKTAIHKSVAAEFEWADLGTWEAIKEFACKNNIPAPQYASV